MRKSKVINLNNYKANKKALGSANNGGSTFVLTLDTQAPSVDVTSTLSYRFNTTTFDFLYNDLDIESFKTWGDYNTTPFGVNHDLCGLTEQDAPWVSVRSEIDYTLGNPDPFVPHIFKFKFRDDVWNEVSVTVEGEYEKTTLVDTYEKFEYTEEYINYVLDDDAGISLYESSVKQGLFDTFTYTDLMTDGSEARPYVFNIKEHISSNDVLALYSLFEDKSRVSMQINTSIHQLDVFEDISDFGVVDADILLRDETTVAVNTQMLLSDVDDYGFIQGKGLINESTTDVAGLYGVFTYLSVYIKDFTTNSEYASFMNLMMEGVFAAEHLENTVPLTIIPKVDEKEFLLEKVVAFDEVSDVAENLAQGFYTVNDYTHTVNLQQSQFVYEYAEYNTKSWGDVDYLLTDKVQSTGGLITSGVIKYNSIIQESTVTDFADTESFNISITLNSDINTFDDVSFKESSVESLFITDDFILDEFTIVSVLLSEFGYEPETKWAFEVNSFDGLVSNEYIDTGLLMQDNFKSQFDNGINNFSLDRTKAIAKSWADEDIYLFDAVSSVDSSENLLFTDIDSISQESVIQGSALVDTSVESVKIRLALNSFEQLFTSEYSSNSLVTDDTLVSDVSIVLGQQIKDTVAGFVKAWADADIILRDSVSSKAGSDLFLYTDTSGRVQEDVIQTLSFRDNVISNFKITLDINSFEQLISSEFTTTSLLISEDFISNDSVVLGLPTSDKIVSETKSWVDADILLRDELSSVVYSDLALYTDTSGEVQEVVSQTLSFMDNVISDFKITLDINSFEKLLSSEYNSNILFTSEDITGEAGLVIDTLTNELGSFEAKSWVDADILLKDALSSFDDLLLSFAAETAGNLQEDVIQMLSLQDVVLGDFRITLDINSFEQLSATEFNTNSLLINADYISDAGIVAGQLITDKGSLNSKSWVDADILLKDHTQSDSSQVLSLPIDATGEIYESTAQTLSLSDFVVSTFKITLDINSFETLFATEYNSNTLLVSEQFSGETGLVLGTATKELVGSEVKSWIDADIILRDELSSEVSLDLSLYTDISGTLHEGVIQTLSFNDAVISNFNIILDINSFEQLFAREYDSNTLLVSEYFVGEADSSISTLTKEFISVGSKSWIDADILLKDELVSSVYSDLSLFTETSGITQESVVQTLSFADNVTSEFKITLDINSFEKLFASEYTTTSLLAVEDFVVSDSVIFSLPTVDTSSSKTKFWIDADILIKDFGKLTGSDLLSIPVDYIAEYNENVVQGLSVNDLLESDFKITLDINSFESLSASEFNTTSLLLAEDYVGDGIVVVDFISDDKTSAKVKSWVDAYVLLRDYVSSVISSELSLYTDIYGEVQEEVIQTLSFRDNVISNFKITLDINSFETLAANEYNSNTLYTSDYFMSDGSVVMDSLTTDSVIVSDKVLIDADILLKDAAILSGTSLFTAAVSDGGQIQETVVQGLAFRDLVSSEFKITLDINSFEKLFALEYSTTSIIADDALVSVGSAVINNYTSENYTTQIHSWIDADILLKDFVISDISSELAVPISGTGIIYENVVQGLALNDVVTGEFKITLELNSFEKLYANEFNTQSLLVTDDFIDTASVVIGHSITDIISSETKSWIDADILLKDSGAVQLSTQLLVPVNDSGLVYESVIQNLAVYDVVNSKFKLTLELNSFEILEALEYNSTTLLTNDTSLFIDSVVIGQQVVDTGVQKTHTWIDEDILLKDAITSDGGVLLAVPVDTSGIITESVVNTLSLMDNVEGEFKITLELNSFENLYAKEYNTNSLLISDELIVSDQVVVSQSVIDVGVLGSKTWVDADILLKGEINSSDRQILSIPISYTENVQESVIQGLASSDLVIGTFKLTLELNSFENIEGSESITYSILTDDYIESTSVVVLNHLLTDTIHISGKSWIDADILLKDYISSDSQQVLSTFTDISGITYESVVQDLALSDEIFGKFKLTLELNSFENVIGTEFISNSLMSYADYISLDAAVIGLYDTDIVKIKTKSWIDADILLKDAGIIDSAAALALPLSYTGVIDESTVIGLSALDLVSYDVKIILELNSFEKVFGVENIDFSLLTGEHFGLMSQVVLNVPSEDMGSLIDRLAQKEFDSVDYNYSVEKTVVSLITSDLFDHNDFSVLSVYADEQAKHAIKYWIDVDYLLKDSGTAQSEVLISLPLNYHITTDALVVMDLNALDCGIGDDHVVSFEKVITDLGTVKESLDFNIDLYESGQLFEDSILNLAAADIITSHIHTNLDSRITQYDSGIGVENPTLISLTGVDEFIVDEVPVLNICVTKVIKVYFDVDIHKDDGERIKYIYEYDFGFGKELRSTINLMGSDDFIASEFGYTSLYSDEVGAVKDWSTDFYREIFEQVVGIGSVPVIDLSEKELVTVEIDPLISVVSNDTFNYTDYATEFYKAFSDGLIGKESNAFIDIAVKDKVKAIVTSVISLLGSDFVVSKDVLIEFYKVFLDYAYGKELPSVLNTLGGDAVYFNESSVLSTLGNDTALAKDILISFHKIIQEYGYATEPQSTVNLLGVDAGYYFDPAVISTMCEDTALARDFLIEFRKAFIDYGYAVELNTYINLEATELVDSVDDSVISVLGSDVFMAYDLLKEFSRDYFDFGVASSSSIISHFKDDMGLIYKQNVIGVGVVDDGVASFSIKPTMLLLTKESVEALATDSISLFITDASVARDEAILGTLTFDYTVVEDKTKLVNIFKEKEDVATFDEALVAVYTKDDFISVANAVINSTSKEFGSVGERYFYDVRIDVSDEAFYCENVILYDPTITQRELIYFWDDEYATTEYKENPLWGQDINPGDSDYPYLPGDPQYGESIPLEIKTFDPNSYKPATELSQEILTQYYYGRHVFISDVVNNPFDCPFKDFTESVDLYLMYNTANTVTYTMLLSDKAQFTGSFIINLCNIASYHIDDIVSVLQITQSYTDNTTFNTTINRSIINLVDLKVLYEETKTNRNGLKYKVQTCELVRKNTNDHNIVIESFNKLYNERFFDENNQFVFKLKSKPVKNTKINWFVEIHVTGQTNLGDTSTIPAFFFYNSRGNVWFSTATKINPEYVKYRKHYDYLPVQELNPLWAEPIKLGDFDYPFTSGDLDYGREIPFKLIDDSKEYSTYWGGDDTNDWGNENRYFQPNCNYKTCKKNTRIILLDSHHRSYSIFPDGLLSDKLRFEAGYWLIGYNYIDFKVDKVICRISKNYKIYDYDDSIIDKDPAYAYSYAVDITNLIDIRQYYEDEILLTTYWPDAPKGVTVPRKYYRFYDKKTKEPYVNIESINKLFKKEFFDKYDNFIYTVDGINLGNNVDLDIFICFTAYTEYVSGDPIVTQCYICKNQFQVLQQHQYITQSGGKLWFTSANSINPEYLEYRQQYINKTDKWFRAIDIMPDLITYKLYINMGCGVSPVFSHPPKDDMDRFVMEMQRRHAFMDITQQFTGYNGALDESAVTDLALKDFAYPLDIPTDKNFDVKEYVDPCVNVTIYDPLVNTHIIDVSSRWVPNSLWEQDINPGDEDYPYLPGDVHYGEIIPYKINPKISPDLPAIILPVHEGSEKITINEPYTQLRFDTEAKLKVNTISIMVSDPTMDFSELDVGIVLFKGNNPLIIHPDVIHWYEVSIDEFYIRPIAYYLEGNKLVFRFDTNIQIIVGADYVINPDVYPYLTFGLHLEVFNDMLSTFGVIETDAYLCGDETVNPEYIQYRKAEFIVEESEKSIKYWWEPGYAPGGKPYYRGLDSTGKYFKKNLDWGKPIEPFDVDYPYFKDDSKFGEVIDPCSVITIPVSTVDYRDCLQRWWSPDGTFHPNNRELRYFLLFKAIAPIFNIETTEFITTEFNNGVKAPYSVFEAGGIEQYYRFGIPWIIHTAIYVDCYHYVSPGEYKRVPGDKRKVDCTLTLVSTEEVPRDTWGIAVKSIYQVKPVDGNVINCYDLFPGYDLTKDYFEVYLGTSVSGVDYKPWTDLPDAVDLISSFRGIYYGTASQVNPLYLQSRRQVIYEDDHWFVHTTPLYYEPTTFKLYINQECGMLPGIDRAPENDIDKFVLDMMTRYAYLNLDAHFVGDHSDVIEDSVISLPLIQEGYYKERWDIAYDLTFTDYGYACEDTVVYSPLVVDIEQLSGKTSHWERNPLWGQDIKPGDSDYPFVPGDARYGETIQFLGIVRITGSLPISILPPYRHDTVESHVYEVLEFNITTSLKISSIKLNSDIVDVSELNIGVVLFKGVESQTSGRIIWEVVKPETISDFYIKAVSYSVESDGIVFYFDPAVITIDNVTDYGINPIDYPYTSFGVYLEGPVNTVSSVWFIEPDMYLCEYKGVNPEYSQYRKQDRLIEDPYSPVMYWWEKGYPIVKDPLKTIANPLLGKSIKVNDFDYPYAPGEPEYGVEIKPEKVVGDILFDQPLKYHLEEKIYHLAGGTYPAMSKILFYPIKEFTDGMEVALNSLFAAFVGNYVIKLVVIGFDHKITNYSVIDISKNLTDHTSPYVVTDFGTVETSLINRTYDPVTRKTSYTYRPKTKNISGYRQVIRQHDINLDIGRVSPIVIKSYVLGLYVYCDPKIVEEGFNSENKKLYTYLMHSDLSLTVAVEEYNAEYLKYRAPSAPLTDLGYVIKDFYDDFFGVKLYSSLGCGPDLDAFPIVPTSDFERWVFTLARLGNLDRDYLHAGDLGYVKEAAVEELRVFLDVQSHEVVKFDLLEMWGRDYGHLDYSFTFLIPENENAEFIEPDTVITVPKTVEVNSSEVLRQRAYNTLIEKGVVIVTSEIDLFTSDFNVDAYESAVVGVITKDTGFYIERPTLDCKFTVYERLLGIGTEIIDTLGDDVFYSVDDSSITLSFTQEAGGDDRRTIEFKYAFDWGEFIGKPVVNDSVGNQYYLNDSVVLDMALDLVPDVHEYIKPDRTEIYRDVGYVCFWVQIVDYPYVIDWLAGHYVNYYNDLLEANYIRFTSCFGMPPGGWPKVKNYPDITIIPKDKRKIDKIDGKYVRDTSDISGKGGKIDGRIKIGNDTDPDPVVYIPDPGNLPEPYEWVGGTSIFILKLILDLEMDHFVYVVDIFYFALFNENLERVSKIQRMTMRSHSDRSGKSLSGACYGAMIFYDLEPDTTYYIYETDQYGNIQESTYYSEYSNNKYLLPQLCIPVTTVEGKCISDDTTFMNLVEELHNDGDDKVPTGDDYEPKVGPTDEGGETPTGEPPRTIIVPKDDPNPVDGSSIPWPPVVDGGSLPILPDPIIGPDPTDPDPNPDDDDKPGPPPGLEGSLYHRFDTPKVHEEGIITVPVDMYAVVWEKHYIPATFILELSGIRIEFIDEFKVDLDEPFRFDSTGFGFEVDEPFNLDLESFYVEVEEPFDFIEDNVSIAVDLTFHLDEVVFELTTLFEDVKFDLIDYDGDIVQAMAVPEVIAEVIVYDGNRHPLCYSRGKHGTIYYQVEGDDSWSTDVPIRVEAGSYTVKWYAMASTEYTEYGSPKDYNKTYCTIRRATPYVVSDSLYAEYGKSKIVELLYVGDGEFFCSSSDTSILSCELISKVSVTDTTVATTKVTLRLTGKGSGTANIVCKSELGTNYFALDKEIPCTVKASIIRFKASPVTVIYGSGIPESNIEVYGPEKYIILYASQEMIETETPYTDKIDFYSEVGDYTVYFVILANNYETVTGKFKLSITLISQDIKFEVYHAKYDEQSHVLISNVTGAYGTLWYSVDKITWLADIPIGTMPGKYPIYWFCVGDENHYDEGTSEYPNEVVAEIEKKDISVHLDNITIDLRYPEVKIIEIPTPSTGKMTVGWSDYALIDVRLRDTVLTVKAYNSVGAAFVYIKQEADEIYNEHVMSFHVDVIDTTIYYHTVDVTTVYNDQVVTESGVIIDYKDPSVYTILYSKTPITRYAILSPTPDFYKYAGVYTIYFMIKAYDYEPVYDSYTLTIKKAPNKAVVHGLDLVYNGTDQNLVEVEPGYYGTIFYQFKTILWSSEWSDVLPNISLVGDYEVHWFCKGDSNHEDVGSKEDYNVVYSYIRKIDFVSDVVSLEINLAELSAEGYVGYHIDTPSDGVFYIKDISYSVAGLIDTTRTWVNFDHLLKIYPLHPGEVTMFVKQAESATYNEHTFEFRIKIYDPRYYGSVIDAVTAKGISGATVIFRRGDSMSGDYVEKVITDSSGEYIVEVEPGEYTIEVSCDGYITEYFTCNIEVYKNNLPPIALVSDHIDAIIMVLTWGEKPNDLDSHLMCNYNGKESVVFYANKKFFVDDVLIAELDVDDRSGYGPETLTIYDTAGEFKYYVVDYGSLLENVNAVVKVYIPNNVKPLEIKFNGVIGHDDWYVLKIVDGEVTIINEIVH